MEVNNTTSRQEHWWFIMRQRASGTVNPEMKKQANIYMFSQIFCFLLLLYKCQKRISWSCPSRFRFRTSPWYLMVVLLPSWGKNKCRALKRRPTVDISIIHYLWQQLHGLQTYTFRYCYDAMQYVMILHTSLQWWMQNIYGEFGSIKDTPHPNGWIILWGAFCENIGENYHVL